jgi:electron transfer flavoprotein alpha/beta subunit
MNFLEARNSVSALAPEPSSSLTISPAVRGGRAVVSSTAVQAASSPTSLASTPMSLSDLGVDADQVGLAAAWTEVVDTTARPPRTAGEIVKDEDGSGATALTEFLASKKFI